MPDLEPQHRSTTQALTVQFILGDLGDDIKVVARVAEDGTPVLVLHPSVLDGDQDVRDAAFGWFVEQCRELAKA